MRAHEEEEDVVVGQGGGEEEAVNAVCAVAVFRPGVRLDLSGPTAPTVTQDALCEHILGLSPAPRPVLLSEIEPLFAPVPLAKGRRVPLTAG